MIDLFKSLEKQPNSALTPIRAEAWERFQQLGFPSKRDEDWHYTSVKAVSEVNFALPTVFTKPSFSLAAVLNPKFLNFVFVNGLFNSELSSPLPSWMKLQKQDWNPEFLGTVANATAFEALNLSFMQQILEINIPEKTVVDKPVNLVFVATENKTMIHPRLHLKLGAAAKMTLIESSFSEGESILQNSASEIEVRDSAQLQYIRLQQDSKKSFSIGKTIFDIWGNAVVNSLSVALGGKISRHEMDVNLLQTGASANINGITLGTQEQHHDHFTRIDHRVGGCTTDQLYKAVLAGSSRSVFTGKVLIRKDAQKASSQQLNKNLLLSKKAEADSRPQLEILADDVKATHGSTVGQLSEEEIFYLQSRGIRRQEAEEFLSLGFLQELTEKVDSPVREWLQPIVLEHYRAGVSS